MIMKVGQRIRNIHTGNEYTIIEIHPPPKHSVLLIFEVASDDGKDMRFNSMYEKHYEVLGDEEE